MHTVQGQLGVRGEQEGPDIQGGAGRRGHPGLVHLHQLLDGGHGDVGGHQGQSDALGGVVQALHIGIMAEKLYFTVLAAVGLQPLKHLAGIVKDAGGGRQAQGAEGDDAGIMPALFAGVVHNEHMVGKHGTKAQLVRGGHGTGIGIFGDGEFHERFASFPGDKVAYNLAR